MSTHDRLLDAGAVLPGDGPADPAVTVLTARDYTHPALPGRTVVRLASAPVGAAEDLSMEFLGFTAGPAGPVGHARTRTLGFPAWVLVHDPAHGREALALVKDMEKLARTARSKPGNARDGYEALARRLGATVPHFLPPFWEQAGRAYLAADNLRQAAMCFTAARRAEQVHGLAVDERRLRDVHLEFALAGALPGKALTEYARDVAGRRPGPEAYALVREVAVHRVAGGLAPGAGFAAELRRLAKAAGLDGAAEDESLARELLGLPAVVRAHESLWKAYRPALQRLARREPAVTARLLAIVPDPADAGGEVLDQWLELLEATGAADALARGEADAADWLERFAQHRAARHRQLRKPCPRLTALVERLAPRLRAAGRPLRLHAAHGATDLNLMDRCLSLDVPVADHHGWPDGLPLHLWFDAEPAGRRDLAAIAADPVLLPALTRGVWQLLDRYSHVYADRTLATARLAEILVLPGVRAAARAGIAQVTTRVDDTTLAGLELVAKALAPLWSAAGVAVAPEDLRRTAAADIAATLARTLRAGLVDELGWPAYDAAVTALKRVHASDSWPAAAVTDEIRVVAVPPEGEPFEHVIQTPPDSSWHSVAIGCREVDGRLLVTGDGYQGHWGYWADRPGEPFVRRGGERVWTGGPMPHLPLPGGGVTTGSRPWHAGDGTEPRRYPVSSDGTTYWRCEPDGDAPGPATGWRWREYDPATGHGGRYGGPAFFADGAPADGRLAPLWSWLRPAPAAYAGSPLGCADGLLGWRLHVLPDGSQLGRSVDGRTVRLTAAAPGHHLVGALTLPGDDRPRPVTAKDATWVRGAHLTVTVWDADGTSPVQECAATHTRPPFTHWHALRPRDEAGSAALRAVTTELAAALLSDVAAGGQADLDGLIDRAVQRRLPALTHPEPRRAIRGLVRTALRLTDRLAGLAKLVEAAAPAPAMPATSGHPTAGTAAAAPTVSDAELAGALEPLVRWHARYYDGTTDVRAAVLGQVTGLADALDEVPGAKLPNAEAPWPQLLPGLGALLTVAASPTSSDARRLAVTRLLRAFADSPFAAPDSRVRFVELAVDENFRWAGLVRAGERRIAFLSGRRRLVGDDGRVRASIRYAVDRCPEAAFAPIEGIEVRREIRRAGWGEAARLRTAADLLDREGAAPLRPEAAVRLAELTGLTRPEAVLLLAGLPIGDQHEPALTPALRKVLGLSAAEARLARARWHDVAHEHRVVLLDAAVPDDPARLWTGGPDVDAVAARWTELFGRRTPIAAELLVEAGRVLPGRDGARVVQAVVDPRPDGWMCTDGVSEAHEWHLVTTAGQGEPFTERQLPAAAAALAWLAYRLPAGDPLRARLPRALELLRQRLDNPKLAVGTSFVPQALVPDGLPGLWRSHEQGGYATYHLLPREISTPDDPALVLGPPELSAALRLLRGTALDAAIDEGGTLPAGAYPHDPRHSVPELVAAVAAAHALSPEAAAYYLQLLALPDPTDANAARWLGLTAAGLKPLRAALMAAGLVVEARRARAGRTVFLPGGWRELRAPALPLESWKAESLGLGPESAPLGTVLAGRPVADLFRAVWTRVSTGDGPRYQDLPAPR
ncbi:hypothetical protein [Catellatospora sp. NPDC049609]|uniref:hypothetical protein n=1 Tax=Catellatospora sp. NPDC049609 TaxID=3155505 RepID=UPI00343403DF